MSMRISGSASFVLGGLLSLLTVNGCGDGTTVRGPVERGIPGFGLVGIAGAAGAPNGVTPTANSQFFVMPAESQDMAGLPPAINDPGPGPIDATQCNDESLYEFAVVDDYEAGRASHTYSFNDSTAEMLPLVNKDWEPPATAYPAQWITKFGKNPCGPGSAKSAEVLHLAGHFTDFGAGLGTVLFFHKDETLSGTAIPFTDLSGTVKADGSIVLADGSMAPPIAHPIVYYPGDSTYVSYMPVKPSELQPPGVPHLMSADLSQWEGITFWARRGPFAGPGFRPGILDRTTSDDFNKQLPASLAACRSVYTTCSCPNQKPCMPWEPNDPSYSQPTPAEITSSIEPLIPDTTTGFPASTYPTPTRGTYCWDPKVDKYPPWDPSLRCGDFACDFHSNTPIPSMTYNPVDATQASLWRTDVGKGAASGGAGIGTMTCSPEPYVFKDSTTPSARFCYKPGVDLDPPERMERCNDSFLAGTLLTTNWKRYFIKFSDLRQGMIDKRSSGIDLGMVETMVFAFPGGDMDVWLDDVGFYRKKK
jgi:hypothetical protein